MRPFRPRDEHSALYGISAERIAELCKVHVTTARRWKRGEEPPFTAIQFIELMNTRDLGTLDPVFDGWRIADGRLYPPTDKNGFTPGDVMSISWLRSIIASYQADQRFAAQADWIDGRWVPTYELEAKEA